MRIEGKFLLSYNDCGEIRELYDGCTFFDFKRVHSMVQKYEAGREFPELLIGNYDLFEREKARPRQLTLSPADVRGRRAACHGELGRYRRLCLRR